jgi:hypothetical protein
MDQPNLQNANSSRIAQSPPGKTDEKPIPFDSVDAKPGAVSRQPLSLGAPGGTAAPAPRPASPVAAPKPVSPAAPAAPRPSPVAVKPVQTPVPKNGSGERITGMKTFFAKLHVGSMAFLEEQIQGWLKDNPGVSIKTTNVTTGEIQAKTSEPNLIVVVWY